MHNFTRMSAGVLLWGLLSGLSGKPASFSDLAPGQAYTECAQCPVMVVVPAGRFQMGSTPEEAAAQSVFSKAEDELPQHDVEFAQSFALARGPITVAEFRRFVDATGYEIPDGCIWFSKGEVIPKPEANWSAPGFEQADTHPVTCINQLDAAAYAAWLTEITGAPYRLPSEAEFEYALRAGSDTLYSHKDSLSPADANIVHDGDPAADGFAFTSPVGAFPANAWGLVDMEGNVFEWLADCYYGSYEDAPSDGSAWTNDDGSACDVQMLRGGAWLVGQGSTRARNRDQNVPDMRMPFYGFRVARDLN